MTCLKSPPSTVEGKDELAKNVLAEQFTGREVSMMFTALSSQTFTKLLQVASLDVVSPTLSKIVDAAGILGTNNNGSKVLVDILKDLETKLEKYHAELDKDKVRTEIASVEKFVSEIAGRIIDGLDDAPLDVNALSVLIVLLPMLAGKKLSKELPHTDWVYEEWRFPTPGSFASNLENLTEKIQQLDFKRLVAMLENTQAVHFVQTLLHCFQDSEPELCDRIVDEILSGALFTVGSGSELPVAFTERKYVYFASDLLTTMSPSAFRTMFERCQPLISTMAVHPVANFILQKMLVACHQKKQVFAILTELKSVFANFGGNRSLGLLVSTAAALSKHGCKEDLFMKALKAGLKYDGEDGKSFVEFFLTMLLAADGKLSGKEKSNGSKILQTLLKFTGSREVITEFLALDPTTLVRVSRDKHLSFVFKAFFSSSSVTDEEKTEMINKLMDNLASMVRDQSAIFVVLEMWDYANLLLKRSIAQELAKHLKTLEADKLGNTVCGKFKLVKLIKTPKKWLRHLGEETENATKTIIEEMKVEVATMYEAKPLDEDDDPDSEPDDPEEEELLGDSESEEESPEDDDEDDGKTPSVKKRKMNSAAASSVFGSVPKKQKIGQKIELQ